MTNGLKTCCICKIKFNGYGHNPAPVKLRGRACNFCNETVVMRARLNTLFSIKEEKNGSISSDIN